MNKGNPHLQSRYRLSCLQGPPSNLQSKPVLSERELQLPAQIPRYLRIFYQDIHRSNSASKKQEKHEMSFWLRHQPVICFKTKGFIKKLTAPYKNCQLEIGKIYVLSPAPRYLSRMS